MHLREDFCFVTILPTYMCEKGHVRSVESASSTIYSKFVIDTGDSPRIDCLDLYEESNSAVRFYQHWGVEFTTRADKLLCLSGFGYSSWEEGCWSRSFRSSPGWPINVGQRFVLKIRGIFYRQDLLARLAFEMTCHLLLVLNVYLQFVRFAKWMQLKNTC